jgi:hypothetical protein
LQPLDLDLQAKRVASSRRKRATLRATPKELPLRALP